jgi:transposase
MITPEQHAEIRHYHFAPRPCTPGRGNEKGKVERQIQHLRHAFFAVARLSMSTI